MTKTFEGDADKNPAVPSPELRKTSELKAVSASEQEWVPEIMKCDCCGREMEFIGLSLYACYFCPSDCDGKHGDVDDFGGEGPTGCMDDGDGLSLALRGMSHQDLNRILDRTLNAPEAGRA